MKMCKVKGLPEALRFEVVAGFGTPGVGPCRPAANIVDSDPL